VDLHTTIHAGGRLVAESRNTFYAQGRFGPAGEALPPQPPPGSAGVHAQWRLRGGGGRRFGALTGDYNGLHLWNGYARAMGFRAAFFHPLRMVAQVLARAGLEGFGPWRVDAWLRGPVFHGSQVRLRVDARQAFTVLELLVGDEPRPAIVTAVRPASAGDRLEAGGLPDPRQASAWRRRESSGACARSCMP
jgi:hypothetical protein